MTTDKTTYRNMVLNGLALFVLAINLTGPVHEGVHMLTQMAAGLTPHYLSFGVMDTVGTATVDLSSPFWKIMFSGSAAIFNVCVGLVLVAVLRFCKLGPLSRQFSLLLCILHLCMGFGYFLRDGIAYFPNNGMGDWSKVLDNFDGSLPLRIGMLVVGSVGWLLALYLVYREAYHFIDLLRERSAMAAPPSCVVARPLAGITPPTTEPPLAAAAERARALAVGALACRARPGAGACGAGSPPAAGHNRPKEAAGRGGRAWAGT